MTDRTKKVVINIGTIGAVGSGVVAVAGAALAAPAVAIAGTVALAASGVITAIGTLSPAPTKVVSSQPPSAPPEPPQIVD
jgi:hypothetical protein